jgi:hypothetical protein
MRENAMSRSRSTRNVTWAGALAAVLVAAGCQRNGGVSDYERYQQARQEAEQSKQDLASSLKGQGIKLEKKRYPQGEAWAVDLKGANVTDDLLTQLSKLGYISEVNLSKSTVTDAHLAKMNDLRLLAYCLKLDLSQTAVTDAGLDALTNTLGGLSDLNLAGTKVTPAAADRLKKRRQADARVPAPFKNTKVHF